MCGSPHREDTASCIPLVALLPEAVPVSESAIQAVLMGSCFLGKVSTILFIPSSPVKWPGSPVSPYTCWIATFMEKKNKVGFVMSHQLIYWNQNFWITLVMRSFINFTRLAKYFCFKAPRNVWPRARDEADASEHSWFGEGVSAQHSN